MKWESFVTADLSGSSLLLPTDHKISEIREAPAAAIITDALRYLGVATLEANTLDLKRPLEQKWVRQATWCRWKSRL